MTGRPSADPAADTTAYLPPVRVCRLDELPAVGAVAADVQGRVVALVRTDDGSVHCIDDRCTHANVSLAEGEVEGCTIECWLHGSRFDLVSGDPTGPPATIPVAVHHVIIDGDDVLVALKNDQN